MSKISAWISAARLRTLPLSVSGIITGTAVAYTHDAFSTTIFVLALITTLGFQVLSNFANDYGDGVKGTDTEDRVGPARALQSGLLSRKELKRGMWITAALTLFVASVLIFIAFGNEHFLMSLIFFNLGIVAIIAAITYTIGKRAYGYRAMGDLFVFVFFGLIGVMGSYFLYTQSVAELIVLPACVIGCLSAAVLNLNNMRDRVQDARVGKNTLAVVMGEKTSKLYHALLILAGLIAAILYYWFKQEGTSAPLPLTAFVPLLFHLNKVFRNKDTTKLDPELKKVALCTFCYSVLLFVTNFI